LPLVWSRDKKLKTRRCNAMFPALRPICREGLLRGKSGRLVIRSTCSERKA